LPPLRDLHVLWKGIASDVELPAPRSGRVLFFFFSSRRRHTRCYRDWSSDVCSSDLVRRAVKDMRVDYPIAIDNDYAIWRGFNNEYWPALYFIDAQGQIRHHYFGEGEYEESEVTLQQLLAEAGHGGIGHEGVSVDARG